MASDLLPARMSATLTDEPGPADLAGALHPPDAEYSREATEHLVREALAGAALVPGPEGWMRVVSHYDPDGLTSAAIAARALMRRGTPFQITIAKGLDGEVLQNLLAEKNGVVLICDMGSGQMELVRELATVSKVVICDHHLSSGEPGQTSHPVVHINPHRWGIDGTSNGSGATATFILAVAMDSCNWDLSQLALTGVVADRQHTGGLKGINSALAARATEMGFIENRRELCLIGTAGRTLKEFLATSIEPYFPGLAGRPPEAGKWLEELGLPPSAHYGALDEPQRSTLLSGLLLRLLKSGVRPEIAEEIVADRLYLRGPDICADDLSGLLNACGRLDEEATGVALCLGDPAARATAEQMREAYHAELRACLVKLEKEGARKLAAIQVIEHPRASLGGVIAGLGLWYILDPERPVFAMSKLKGKTKVSTRATRYLTKKGINLAEACRAAAQSVGGQGGGHPVAAGATVPEGKEEEFLAEADRVVGQQLAGRGR